MPATRRLRAILLLVALLAPSAGTSAAHAQTETASFSADGSAEQDAATSTRTTKDDWETSCPQIPASQGRDGHVFVLPERLSTDVWFADMHSPDGPALHDLDMYFYDGQCRRLTPVEDTADLDARERSEMPVGTRYIVGSAFLGAPYTLRLDVSFLRTSPPAPESPPPGGSGQPAPCVLPAEGAAPSSTASWPSASPSLGRVGAADHDAVTAVGEGAVHAGGFYDGMHSSRDSGATWSQVAGPSSVRATHFIDEATGWAAGSGTTAFLTRDGGVSWSACAFDSGISAAIFDIDFTDASTGFLAGKTFGTERPLLYRTADAGVTWTAQDPGGLTSGVITAIDFVDPLHGFAVGPSVALRTVDGGVTWESMPVGTTDLQAVVATPDAVVAAAFGGSIYRSTDQGRTWRYATLLPCCPKSLSFSGGAVFLAGLRGLLASSFDGGATWEREPVGLDDLTEVQAVGPTRAVAVGSDGLVVRVEVRPPAPPAATTTSYFDGSSHAGTFSTTRPTGTQDQLAVDLPLTSATPGDGLDPTWRGRVDGTINRIDLDFWQRSGEDALAYGAYELVIWTGSGSSLRETVLPFFRTTAPGAGPAHVQAVFEGLGIDPRGSDVLLAVRDPLGDGTTVVYGSAQHPSGFTVNAAAPSTIATCSALPVPSSAGAATDDPCLPAQWGLHQVRAPEAWKQSQATGQGIVTAVIDSGIDLTHPDFACPGKVLELSGADIVQDGGSVQDGNGHGTHVAGIIGACTGNGEGVAGVAPDTTLLPVQHFDAAGDSAPDLAQSIDFATEQGAHVINMSLGYGSLTGLVGPVVLAASPELEAAVRRATAAGVVLVAAAGNSADPLCSYPALSADVVCVTAVGRDGQKAGYASFATKADGSGTGPSVAAPGGTAESCENDVLSTWPVQLSTFCATSSGYEAIAGTSMATPHVAGAAALVYERLGGERTAENARAVVAALTATARDAGVGGWDPVYGSGLLDAAAAVTSVVPVAPPAKATSLAFTDRSATSVQHSDEAVVEVRLVDEKGVPVADAPVVLALGDAPPQQVVTGADGLASARLTATGPAGQTEGRAAYAGDARRAAASAATPLRVEHELTRLALEQRGKTASALLQDDDGAPVVGRSVTFFADGEPVGSSTTGPDGVAKREVKCQGKCVASAAFSGDDAYARSNSG